MEITITRNGEKDFKAMYSFMLKKLAKQYGNKIDYLFVNNKWPKNGEEVSSV